ncbi:MAG: 5-formyltetrahydrofolate cyclo-ligase [Bacteroidota bacterium]
MVDKHTLRKVYLEKRLFLSASELNHRNQLLSNLLLAKLPMERSTTIHLFMGINEKNEVDTFGIMKALMELQPSVQFVTSKTKPKGILEHYKIDTNTKFEKNKWHVPEPIGADMADINEIDVVLVPLIIFDKEGNRIGYGKGYYDRFLKLVPNAAKVGITLGPPLDKIEYVGKYDVAMDACCTPFKYYEF